MSVVYLIPIVLAIFWGIQFDRQEDFDKYKSHRFWLLFIILSLITGFSYALGGDKQTYLTHFEAYSSNISDIFSEIQSGFVIRGHMPGWVILNCIAKSVFHSFYFVQLVEAFFINFAVFYTIRRYTQRVFLAVILYCLTLVYFVFNLEVMREAFAVGFFLLGTEAYFRKKYVATFFLFLAAVLFHAFAFVIVLFPFLNFKITLKRFPFVLLASFLFWLTGFFLFNILASSALGQNNLISSKVTLFETYGTSPIAFLIYVFIYLVAPFWIMHLAINKGKADQELIRRKERFMAFYLCIALVVPANLTLFRFLNYPLIVFLCLTTDLLYTLFTEKRHFITKVLCVFAAWGYYTYQYIAINPNTGTSFMDLFFPYTSILDESYDRSYRDYMHYSVTTERTEEGKE